MATNTNISVELELKVIKRAQSGDESALAALMERYSRFVWKVVNKYRNRPFYEEEKIDLYQEGMIAFKTAVDKFDASKNAQLSTYAYLWVNQAVSRYVNQWVPMIRVSDNGCRTFAKMNKLIEDGMSDNAVAKEVRVTTNTLWQLLTVKQPPHSLSRPVVDEFNSTLSDVVPSELPSAEEEAITQEVKSQVSQWVAELKDEDQKLALAMRYGVLGQSSTHTFESIAKTLTAKHGEKTWNKEAVRQLVINALRSLKRLASKQTVVHQERVSNHADVSLFSYSPQMKQEQSNTLDEQNLPKPSQ